MNQLTDIIDFHTKFKQYYDGPPRMMVDELLKFRLKFLGEELKELAAAHGVVMEVNLVGTCEPPPQAMPLAFDALIDMDYVLKGTVHLMGFSAVYQEGWRRVHHANMTKELARSVQASTDATGRGYAFDVIKPPGWRPPYHLDLMDPALVPGLPDPDMTPTLVR